MDEAFPWPEYTNWTVCQALFPHAEMILSYRPTKKNCLKEWAAILDRTAAYAWLRGNFVVAEKMEREALDSREKVLGKEDISTLSYINNLAVLLGSQGKYDEAKLLYQQALALMKKVLGKEHPDTLGSMNNLAILLESQGKYDEAKQLYQHTLALREKVLGKEHPNTLRSMSNLARLLENMKQSGAATLANDISSDREETS
jgi:tetratricopeptide (TPR) repeat protein